jgi:TPR repeat protein
MKITKAVLVFLFIPTLCVMGQSSGDRVYQAEQARDRQANIAQQKELAAENAYSQQQRQKLAFEERVGARMKATLDNFPWRIINGVTQEVSVGWCAFSGTILDNWPKGVRVQGEYHTMYPAGAVSFRGEFFVKGYPYPARPNDPVQASLAAKPSEMFTLTAPRLQRTFTLHALDFGLPCDAPPVDTNAIQLKAEVAKQSANERILAANEAAAAQGDPYGLLRMGERYRDGDGVETNLDKARDYFTRAAAAGDLTASNELVALPPIAPVTTTTAQK